MTQEEAEGNINRSNLKSRLAIIFIFLAVFDFFDQGFNNRAAFFFLFIVFFFFYYHRLMDIKMKIFHFEFFIKDGTGF